MRSLARVGAIKRVFGGHHVVLIRDPVQQWLSARSQRLKHGSPYFELGVDARLNVHALQRDVAERILMEQSELAPELVPHDAEPGEDHDGPTATGAPRRA